MDAANQGFLLHPPGSHRGPSGRRPLSDSFAGLEPSPLFRETAAAAKDDTAIMEDESPRTPGRSSLLARGLSLQMPAKQAAQSSAGNSAAIKSPLSPPIDPYGSPATSIPRHSRGLDFSRASTNLHHSTLAELSPDSSPITTQRGLAIPPSRKGSINSMMLDSPNLGPTAAWPSFLTTERSALSSSVGSVNMLASPSGSSESDDRDISDDNEDYMCTPQANRVITSQTPYNPTAVQSPNAGLWSNNFSPAAASLMKNFQRSKFRRGRSRKSSGSAGSAMQSPRNTSPPALRSIESANGYVGRGKLSSSRRESLALGTDQLHLSSGNDSGDESKEKDTSPSTTPGVVRRAVTRRGNLLPKTKGFARIRAALMEESAPVDSEVRREAETIKQVRERDTDVNSAPGARSPSLLPTVPGPESVLDDIPESMPELERQLSSGESKGLDACFSTHAAQYANTRYWDRLDKSFRTPPPPTFPRAPSSLPDAMIDSPPPSNELPSQQQQPEEMMMQPYEVPAPTPPFLAKTIGKRARDEDMDVMSIKRRAVSPSLSATNSPVVGHSPREHHGSAKDAPQRDRAEGGAHWGGPPRLASMAESGGGGHVVPGHQRRSNSGGSVSSLVSGVAGLQGGGVNPGPPPPPNNNGAGQAGAGAQQQQQQQGPRRVGLQGMTDTNDGLMKMSIE